MRMFSVSIVIIGAVLSLTYFAIGPCLFPRYVTSRKFLAIVLCQIVRFRCTYFNEAILEIQSTSLSCSLGSL